MVKKPESQARLFRALADPTRLEIVKLLSRQRSPDALCVYMLARAVDVSQSAVSQHLRILKSVGLVSGERRGYHVHYSLDKKASSQCRDLVASLFSGTAPGETEPTKRKRISTRHSRPKTQ